ncbi:DMT family transporter [Pseudomonas syringae pv. dysoxyli]|uniref:DMT family transporter n=1 Tax=Pseudomonas syringae TaxID=317 RepID=UPI0013727585|nr:DMT family transporter [Pseudomonas syringae]NAO28810.1 DMT family transporter [Pseudomonas syringae pv. dysoxyli]
MNKLVYPAFGLLGLIWGTNFIFMKWAAVLISPMQIVLLRVLFGFVPILLLALSRRALRWSDLRQSHHFIAMSLLATTFYYLAFAKGASLLPSGIAGMLSGAIPLFAFLTAFIFLRQEPITRLTVLGLLIGFLGVILIARPWDTAAEGISLSGVLYMVGGSLSLGCSFVYARKFLVDKSLSPLALSTYQIGFESPLISWTTPCICSKGCFWPLAAHSNDRFWPIAASRHRLRSANAALHERLQWVDCRPMRRSAKDRFC